MNIKCRTLFDCTTTGTTGSFRPSQVPFQDHSGTEIGNLAQWNISRNKQRNWETLLQIMQLRSQIDVVQTARAVQQAWEFEFSVENDWVYGENLAELVKDAEGVPMLIGLGETSVDDRVLHSSGADQNIWFETINN